MKYLKPQYWASAITSYLVLASQKINAHPLHNDSVNTTEVYLGSAITCIKLNETLASTECGISKILYVENIDDNSDPHNHVDINSIQMLLTAINEYRTDFKSLTYSYHICKLIEYYHTIFTLDIKASYYKTIDYLSNFCNEIVSGLNKTPSVVKFVMGLNPEGFAILVHSVEASGKSGEPNYCMFNAITGNIVEYQNNFTVIGGTGSTEPLD